MSTARALFVVFSLFVAPACLVGEKVNDRNVLHFNLKDSWVGLPGGLVRKADSSLVLYEVPKVKSATYNFNAQFNLGRATLSNDLVTWQLEDDFLDGTKLSLPPTASILAGDILERSGASVDKPYVVAYGTRGEKGEKNRIHTRSVGEDFVVDPKEKGYEAEGVTPSLFEMDKKAYVAYLPSDGSCKVQIAEVKDGAEVTELDLLALNSCRSPRIALLKANKYALIISAKDGSSATVTAHYAVGDVVDGKLSTQNLKFHPFDAGRYANHFTLFKNSDGTLTTVGWNGNEDAGSNNMGGLTLLRKVTYNDVTGLFKQEPLIGKPTKSSEWNVELQPSQPQGMDFNLDEGALVLDMTFQDAQKKMMNNAVVDVTLAVKNENNDNLIVIKVNPTQNTDGMLYQLTVDLKGTEASSIEKAPNKPVPVQSLTGMLKIVVDKSTIEVYGEDGLLVLTESYRLKDGKTLSHVSVTSSVDVKLMAKLHNVRLTVKPTDDLTPSDPATTETATVAPNPKPTTGKSIGAAVSYKTSGLRAVSSLLLVFLVGLSYIVSN